MIGPLDYRFLLHKTNARFADMILGEWNRSVSQGFSRHKIDILADNEATCIVQFTIFYCGLVSIYTFTALHDLPNAKGDNNWSHVTLTESDIRDMADLFAWEHTMYRQKWERERVAG